jgi:hypothetical protein
MSPTDDDMFFLRMAAADDIFGRVMRGLRMEY